MDIGIDTLVYFTLGVVFVLAELLRMQKIVPQKDLSPESEVKVPSVYYVPVPFQRNDPGLQEPVHPECSLTDLPDLPVTDPGVPEKPPDRILPESLPGPRPAMI